jgi:hypothetical protein
MLIRQPINFEEGGGLPQARIQHAFQGQAERDGCIPEDRRPASALAGRFMPLDLGSGLDPSGPQCWSAVLYAILSAVRQRTLVGLVTFELPRSRA